MGDSFEIGLRDIYDKLVGLEKEVKDGHLQVAVTQAELNQRVKSLEDDKVSRRALWGTYVSSAITLVMSVIALLVKVG